MIKNTPSQNVRLLAKTPLDALLVEAGEDVRFSGVSSDSDIFALTLAKAICRSIFYKGLLVDSASRAIMTFKKRQKICPSFS
jgi:hypothetical protein